MLVEPAGIPAGDVSLNKMFMAAVLQISGASLCNHCTK
jgi:hypothetical protein